MRKDFPDKLVDMCERTGHKNVLPAGPLPRVKVIVCKEEKILIHRTIECLLEEAPHMVVDFNGSSFDWPVFGRSGNRYDINIERMWSYINPLVYFNTTRFKVIKRDFH